MLIILVLSNILQWALLLTIAKSAFPVWIELRWEQTFFGKVRYGFSIWKCRISGPNSTTGRRIFQFCWRNPKTISDKLNEKPSSRWASLW